LDDHDPWRPAFPGFMQEIYLAGAKRFMGTG